MLIICTIGLKGKSAFWEKTEGGAHAESQQPKTWEQAEQPHLGNMCTMAKKRPQQRGTSATPMWGVLGTVAMSHNESNFSWMGNQDQNGKVALESEQLEEETLGLDLVDIYLSPRLFLNGK